MMMTRVMPAINTTLIRGFTLLPLRVRAILLVIASPELIPHRFVTTSLPLWPFFAVIFRDAIFLHLSVDQMSKLNATGAISMGPSR